jgi:hypothetical protein
MDAQSGAILRKRGILKSCTNGRIARLLSLLLLVAPWGTAHAVDQSATPSSPPPAAGHHKSKIKKPTPLILPPLPAGPLPQVPMTQLPAAAPRVTYQNGQLSIAAQNSTLGEILRDVRKMTGASIDIPQGATNERVVAYVGPGAPRDVLATLLNGTSFNYVMLGSATDPASVASIQLSLKPSSGEIQTASNNPGGMQPGQQQPGMPGRVFPFRQPPPGGMVTPGANPNAGAEADDNSDDSDNNATNAEDDSDQNQPVQPAAPGMIQQPDANLQQDQNEPNQPNGGPKTPEQLLQMMRQAQPPGGPNGFPGVIPPQQPPQ